MDQPAVCVVGSLSVDLVVTCERLPRAGQTVIGTSYETFPGGKGAGQAVAAVRSGAATTVIGRVGRDHHARELRALLQRERVDTVGVAESWSAPTGTATIAIDAGGERVTFLVPGANGQLDPGFIDEARRSVLGARVLLTQLHTPMDAVHRAAERAKEGFARVILNVAPAQALPAELTPLLDVIVLNMAEARVLTGLPDAPDSDVERALAALGVPVAVLTMGPAGIVALTGGERWFVPAFPVETIDAAGAGDVFIGALGARWAELTPEGVTPTMDSLREALVYASAAGSLATTKRGTVASTPRREEILALMTQSPTGG